MNFWQLQINPLRTILVLALVAVAAAFAQNDQTKNVVIGQSNFAGKIINGTAFLTATDAAKSLGLVFTQNTNELVFTQGGRIIQFDLADNVYTAASRNDGFSINGEWQNGPASAELDGQPYVPIKALAEAAGATVKDSGSDISVNFEGAELLNVKKTLSETADRISIELSRDVGYSTNLEAGELVIKMFGATVGEGDYQVGGKYIQKLPVTQANNYLEAKLKLEDDVGYTIFALPASDGLPARLVLDVGPGLAASLPPLEKMPIRVVLDAGHGGEDLGAKDSGLLEKNIALAAVKKIGKSLSGRGITVRYTRQDDTNPSLKNRQQQSVPSDVFVSIHLSDIVGSTASGITMYYLSPDVPRYGLLKDGRSALEKDNNQALKKVLQHAIASQKESLNLADDISAQLLASSEKQEPQVLTGLFEAVLSEAPKAAILIELGWLSDQPDRKKMNDPEKLSALAEAIAAGIAQYVGRLGTKK